MIQIIAGQSEEVGTCEACTDTTEQVFVLSYGRRPERTTRIVLCRDCLIQLERKASDATMERSHDDA
jgi:hypothetical protein